MIVISDPEYAVSNWYEDIIEGLKIQARKKRVLLDFRTDAANLNCSEPCVFVCGSTYSWLCKIVYAVQKAGKHPIVLNNQLHNSFIGNYSYVTANMDVFMANVLQIARRNGNGEVALYGINTNSISDIGNVDSFSFNNGYAIYYNDKTLKDCFNDFYQDYKEKRFYMVICANDFAAISLIQHLKALGEDINKIKIVSYSDAKISQYYSPSLTSVSMGHKNFGEAAFMIASCINQSHDITGMHISVKGDVAFRETSKGIECDCFQPILPTVAKVDDTFYQDDEICEMMNIEKLLNHCDKTDFKMLSGILSGDSSAVIAESCYLCENSMRYRLRKMKEICDVERKAELCALLKRYNIKID